MRAHRGRAGGQWAVHPRAGDRGREAACPGASGCPRCVLVKLEPEALETSQGPHRAGSLRKRPCSGSAQQPDAWFLVTPGASPGLLWAQLCLLYQCASRPPGTWHSHWHKTLGRRNRSKYRKRDKNRRAKQACGAAHALGRGETRCPPSLPPPACRGPVGALSTPGVTHQPGRCSLQRRDSP